MFEVISCSAALRHWQRTVGETTKIATIQRFFLSQCGLSLSSSGLGLKLTKHASTQIRSRRGSGRHQKGITKSREGARNGGEGESGRLFLPVHRSSNSRSPSAVDHRSVSRIAVPRTWTRAAR